MKRILSITRKKKKSRSLISLKDLSKEEILAIINLASKIKKYPSRYSNKLKGQSLLMMFAKPSLRTHLSFEVAMYQLGGHPIYYSMSDSVLGKKESIKDAARVMSRYVNIIMARLFEHKEMEELSKYSNIPVINHASVPVISGLDNFEHPCQVLGDLLTIKEHKKKLENITISYIGDSNNNVTNSLIFACDKLNIKLQIICPKQMEPKVSGKYSLSHNPQDTKGDILYTDSWFSYHIPESEYETREQKADLNSTNTVENTGQQTSKDSMDTQQVIKKSIIEFLPTILMIALIPIFWNDYILTGIYAVAIILLFLAKRERKEITIFISSAIIITFFEYIFVMTGVEIFQRHTLLGVMPLWLPLLWGYAMVAAKRFLLYVNSHKEEALTLKIKRTH